MAVATVEYHQASTQFRRMSVAVAAGETTPWYIVAHSASVVVSPGAGGSMRVERTQSPPSYVLAGTAVAVAWPYGDVTSATDADVQFTTAVRFVATTAAGIGEIAE